MHKEKVQNFESKIGKKYLYIYTAKEKYYEPQGKAIIRYLKASVYKEGSFLKMSRN